MIKTLEKEVNYSVDQRMKERQDILTPPILPGANAWEQGNVYQVNA